MARTLSLNKPRYPIHSIIIKISAIINYFLVINYYTFIVPNKPKGYDKYVKNENKVLLLLEWLGEMLVTCLSLIFSDFNINKISNWSSILLIAFIIMILYEIYWIRYFKSNKTMKDMYSSLLGIPVAGATLPVVAFLLLGIYGRNIFLIISTIVLGIGHIGIHLNHKKELE